MSEDIIVAAGRHLKERLEHTDLCLTTRVKDTRHAKTLLEEHHAKVGFWGWVKGRALGEDHDGETPREGELCYVL